MEKRERSERAECHVSKRRTKMSAETREAIRRARKTPPPDSSVWPERYRGERWKFGYALLFAGKCQLCAYACPPPESVQQKYRFHRETPTLLCTNHPTAPGELTEVLPTDTCRNFKPKPWKRAPARPADDRTAALPDENDESVRRIPLGKGLFALVDAVDYEEISKHRWYATRRGRQVYAMCRKDGRAIYMHQMVAKPGKGQVVDHKDGNGLNNRRCNLRVCTREQNQANRGPCGGSSQFVGVYRNGGKWQAEIRCRGEWHYVGRFDDEAEAAKARDRKAWELHGEFARLNFPEDFPPQDGDVKSEA